MGSKTRVLRATVSRVTSTASVLEMHANRIDVDGAAIGVKARVIDALIISGQPKRLCDFCAVVDFKNPSRL